MSITLHQSQFQHNCNVHPHELGLQTAVRMTDVVLRFIMLVCGVLYATIIGQMPILSVHAGVLTVRPTVLAISLVVPLTVLESLEVVLVRCSLTHSLARSLPLPLPPTNPHPPTPSLISISI